MSVPITTDRDGPRLSEADLVSGQQTAYLVLSEDAPSARRWIRLARATEPNGKLVLPDRFVGVPVRRPHGLEAEAVEAAAWARALVI